MIDPRLARLAAAQDDLFAVWQLVAAGWTSDRIRHRTAGLERVHDGVVRLGRAPLTARQRWRAATLTTPDSVLSHASVGAYTGFRPNLGGVEVVTRPGRRGRELIGGVLVLWSRRLDDADIVRDAGPPRTTVERALLDLAPALPSAELHKSVREALRLGLTTPAQITATVVRHRGRRGAARLMQLTGRYARLPVGRCRSDAEAMALELLDAAGRPIPQVNVRIAGQEADQYFAPERLIIEIDGPRYHLLRDTDARRTAIWRAAGMTVRRISSDDVFTRPERYLALAPPPAPPGPHRGPILGAPGPL